MATDPLHITGKENSSGSPTAYGESLVAELRPVFEEINRTAPSKDALNRENLLVLEILRERARTGVLPKGFSIHSVVYNIEDRLSRVAPELYSQDVITIPLMRYSVKEGYKNHLPGMQLIETIIQESDFTIPFQEAVIEAHKLLGGLATDVEEVSLPILAIHTDCRTAKALGSIRSVYYSKLRAGRLDRQVGEKSLQDMEELKTAITCHALAALIAYDTRYKYFVIGLGNNKKDSTDFRIYLPHIVSSEQDGYDRIDVCVPPEAVGIIDFLLRVEGKGHTRQELTRRPS